MHNILLFILITLAAQVKPDVVHIYVVDNGVHLELLLPDSNRVINWREFIPVELLNEPEFNRFSYFGFGWGDRNFYINTPEWTDLTLYTALNALLLPSFTVMKVEGWLGIAEHPLYVKKLSIPEDNYIQLVKYIKKHFKYDDKERLKKAAPGYTANDYFFEAKGYYSLFRTSNTWVAQALRTAGVYIPTGILFSFQVMDELIAK
jgi:uncharacterized protein (TIGR02117 family)